MEVAYRQRGEASVKLPLAPPIRCHVFRRVGMDIHLFRDVPTEAVMGHERILHRLVSRLSTVRLPRPLFIPPIFPSSDV